jgi:hypothetical protein
MPQDRVGNALHADRCPARNSTWIESDGVGCGAVGDSCVTVSHRADTVSGSKAVDLEENSADSPRSNARRHLNTWFAFAPSTCAICATLAPGWKVNSTMQHFSDKGCCLHGRRSSTTLPGSAMTHRRQMRDYAPEGKATRLRSTRDTIRSGCYRRWAGNWAGIGKDGCRQRPTRDSRSAEGSENALPVDPEAAVKSADALTQVGTGCQPGASA